MSERKKAINDAMFRRITTVSNLYQAWRKVRANRGAAGVDAVSLELFESNLAENLRELARNLRDKTYEPLPARFILMTKENGTQRELAILSVRDRVAQRAVLDAIEPIFEPRFLDCNYAFRPARNIEMAVQRLIIARSHGNSWILRADVQDFFTSIDRRLLLKEINQQVKDREILRLIQLWLEADALNAAAHSTALFTRGRRALAGAHITLRETVDRAIDRLVAERLGVTNDENPKDVSDYEISDGTFTLDNKNVSEKSTTDDFDENQSVNEAKRSMRRAAIKRLAEDGLTLALAERRALARILPLPVLTFGGVAFAASYFTSAMWRKLRERRAALGTLQGAPLSPLLANIYMQPFDEAVTEAGLRLMRYCDDLAIACRTEEEAKEALKLVEKVSRSRKLKLNPAKTRIVAPGEEFEFLGYRFEKSGRVTPPPNVPEKITREIVCLSQRTARSISRGAKAVAQHSIAKGSATTQAAKGKVTALMKRIRP
jgi:RNA-directed DNA polymerase